MSHPRGLSAEEAAAWEKVAATVKPLDPQPIAVPTKRLHAVSSQPETNAPPPKAAAVPKRKTPQRSEPAASLPPTQTRQTGLDSHWERRLKGGTLAPDFTLDLHGHGLDAAYSRLMSGVAQARAMEARTILLVTGRPRPVAAADRGSSRGAIRAKVLDWLAASSHHSAIAAVRSAHRRHGGEGALYIILKRR
ncbi:MAG: Smr/MutS family protein [Pseudomonadota bacterium]|jgi:DNA-nicking Smr family endonuclease|nr:Smr/MutS family protein [Pseudomonadota bacterium]